MGQLVTAANRLKDPELSQARVSQSNNLVEIDLSLLLLAWRTKQNVAFLLGLVGVGLEEPGQ